MPEPYAQLPGETPEQWRERMERDWPETYKTLRIIHLVDESARARAGEADAG